MGGAYAYALWCRPLLDLSRRPLATRSAIGMRGLHRGSADILGIHYFGVAFAAVEPGEDNLSS